MAQAGRHVGGTRSGKEVLAYGFKKYRNGEVIGTQTEGAVLAATAFLIGRGLLLLAVEDVDGVRLEGVGVAPTIEVQARRPQERLILNSAGRLHCHRLERGCSPNSYAPRHSRR